MKRTQLGTMETIERNPLVSVIIPAFERPNLLKEALASAQNQTYKNFEVIIVDDGSEPPLSESLSVTEDNRVSYHRLKENQGANVARNIGIERSSGGYIAFLDDDDLWNEKKLEQQVKAMEEYKIAGVCYTGQQFLDSSGDQLRSQTPTASGDITKYLLQGHPMTPFSCLLVRSDVIDEAGKPEPDLPIMQDREWLLRLSLYTEFVSIERPMVQHRKGDYRQISDDYEGLLDLAVPYLYDEYLEHAKNKGAKTQLMFRSHLHYLIGSSAIAYGDFSNARRFLFKSLLYWPLDTKTFVKFLATMGGKSTYEYGSKFWQDLRAIKKRM